MQAYQKVLAVTTVACLLGGTAVSQADEWDVSTGHLQLQYTMIRVGSPRDVTPDHCVPVGDRLWFDCPGRRGSTCTVVVTLSAPYQALTPGWNLGLFAAIDDERLAVRPVGALTVAYTADHLAGDNAVTMTLAAPAVRRGVHRLDLCWALYGIEATEPGFVTVQRQTLKLEVYKP